MNYYTSDLHFGHANIIKFCERPWNTVDEMDAALIKKWNDRVTNEDHIYMLGDFCFNKQQFARKLEQLNGIKHIILGNHDPHNVRYATEHIPNVIYHSLIHTVKDDGRKVVLCHYPIYEWNGFYQGVVHFHGHTHGTIGPNFRDNAFDVGVDSQDYEPKTYDEIVGDNYVQPKHQKGEYANKTNKPKDK